MSELLLPSEPWVGLVSAFGVAGVFYLLLVLLRDAPDRVRAIAAMAGVVFVGQLVLRAYGGVTSIFAALALGDFGGRSRSGRLFFDVLLLAVGISAGIYAVLWAHRQTAGDVLVAEEVVADADGEVVDLAEPAPVAAPAFGSREWLATSGPWVDVAALGAAVALPLLTWGALPYGPLLGGLSRSAETSAMAVLYYLVAGVVLAAPLLVVARRTDLVDQRVLAALAGLVALRAVVVPIWPGFFSNEFWTAFGMGLATGLVTAATFHLVRAAIPEDRTWVVLGALVALAVMALSVVLYSRAQLSTVGSFFGEIPEAPGDEFPSLPPFPDFTFGP